MSITIHDMLRWLDLDVSLADHPIRDFVIDSRLIEADDLFIALRGESADGHDYVRHALERKASAALVSKRFADRSPDLLSRLIPVDDPLQSLQKLAAIRRKQFQHPVIAITGTNGKTTTKEMISRVLSVKYRVHKTEGNLNNHIGLPITILRCPEEAEVMVLELGMNHPGELSALAAIADPTHGVLTNIGHGHLGYFGTVEKIGEAKAELLESLRLSGTAFLNWDDTILRKYGRIAARTIRYGFTSDCDVPAKKLTGSSDRPAMHVAGVEIQLRIPGYHQLYNALAAVAVGLDFSIPAASIASCLADFEPFSQRMEKIEIQGILILNDVYNANLDSMKAALETLKGIRSKRTIAILGDIFELGNFSEDQHVRLGEMVEKIDPSCFWGVGPEMAHAFKSSHLNGTDRRMHFKSLDDAISGITGKLRPGDVVLVKGSRGMHMEKLVVAVIEDLESRK
jgi:UDP-N-acetylmuramoyl-tripeptide--D-alanyl-D-alanine ligase